MRLRLFHAGPKGFDVRRIMVIGPNADDHAAKPKHLPHICILYDFICIGNGGYVNYSTKARNDYVRCVR